MITAIKCWTGICRQNVPLLLSSSFIRSLSSEKKNTTTIGFIGLGNMGSPMARNVIAKGHNLVVYDVRQESVTELEEHGAKPANSPQDVANQVECLITMLPNNAAVQEAYHGDRGILKSVKKNAMLIDSSTIDPDLSKNVAKSAEEKGALFLDAPVSGGVNAARQAKLTFMVGGPAEIFPAAQELLFTMGARVVHCGPVGSGQTAKLCNNMLLAVSVNAARQAKLTFMVGGPAEIFPAAQELLFTMGARVVHCGPVGSGQTAKLCNNMLLAVSMIGTAEAMNLGIRLGLEPKLLMDIFNSSTGRCWASEVYCPVPGTMENVPSCNNYEGGFGTKLMFKDLTLVQDMATRATTPTPLGSLAHELYNSMINRGFADKDFSSVYQFLKEQNKA